MQLASNLHVLHRVATVANDIIFEFGEEVAYQFAQICASDIRALKFLAPNSCLGTRSVLLWNLLMD